MLCPKNWSEKSKSRKNWLKLRKFKAQGNFWFKNLVFKDKHICLAPGEGKWVLNPQIFT